MKKLEPEVIATNLREMRQDLLGAKSAVEDLNQDVGEVKPEDMLGGGGDNFEFGEPGEQREQGEPGEQEPGEEKKEKKHEIKTPEDAKKVLNEAKEDLTEVVDALDGLLGTNEEEEKKASVKRFNDRYASTLETLANSAEKAINDASAAIKHWSFIRKYKKEASGVTTPELKKTLETVKEAKSVWQQLGTIFGHKKEGTAVPPTGADFSGDKWPNGKNPAEIELRHWNAGATEFSRDKKKEDKLPNPAVDERLTDEGNPHDEKPYVNASFVFDQTNKYASYWDVLDTKSGRRVIADFNNIPSKLSPTGRKDDGIFAEFSSEGYGNKIASTVIEDGIEVARASLNGHYVTQKEATLISESREPKIKDKSKVRKYYSDMYGDAAYARELTSKEELQKNHKTGSEEGNTDGGMRVDYKPADEHPKEKNKGEAKDGTGKISSQEDPTVILMKAERAVEVARKFASRGTIAFTKEAVKEKARQLMQMDDVSFKVAEKTIDEVPIVNEAALKEAHIPDTEKGIVGNRAEGVRDTKATVDTEDINSNVESDAKIAKKASIVPQMQTDGPQVKDLSGSFNTLSNRLGRKGVDLNSLKGIHKPTYRQG